MTKENNQNTASSVSISQNIKSLDKLVKNNNPEALYKLGMFHYKNNNYDDAVKFLKKAGEQNYADSNYALGEIYYKGVNIKFCTIFLYLFNQKCLQANIIQKDYSLAIKYLTKASEYGDIKALNLLGKIYYEGTKQDYENENFSKTIFKENNYFYWDQVILDNDRKNIVEKPDYIYYVGESIKKDENLAIDYLKKGENVNDVDSIEMLGIIYYHNKNYEEATKMYRNLVDRNNLPDHLEYQYMLGKIDYESKASNQYTSAIQYLKRSSDKNHTESTYMIGKIYLNDGKKNLANEYFEKAAKQGHIEASYILGNLYYKDNDLDAAINYLDIAAKKNHTESNYILGNIYYDGYKIGGIEIEDSTLGIEYLKKVANLNHIKAAYKLGMIYYKDDKKLKIKDVSFGIKYLEKASKQGNIDANYELFKYNFEKDLIDSNSIIDKNVINFSIVPMGIICIKIGVYLFSYNVQKNINKNNFAKYSSALANKERINYKGDLHKECYNKYNTQFLYKSIEICVSSIIFIISGIYSIAKGLKSYFFDNDVSNDKNSLYYLKKGFNEFNHSDSQYILGTMYYKEDIYCNDMILKMKEDAKKEFLNNCDKKNLEHIKSMPYKKYDKYCIKKEFYDEDYIEKCDDGTYDWSGFINHRSIHDRGCNKDYKYIFQRLDLKKENCDKISNSFKIEKNCDEAYKLFNLAAAQNHMDSKYILATMYYEGNCVEINKNKALILLKELANNTHVKSQCTLGKIYYDMDNNCKEALFFLNKAAEQDDSEAQNILGKMYYKGNKCVPMDLSKAKEFLEKAVSNYYPDAEDYLALLHSDL